MRLYVWGDRDWWWCGDGDEAVLYLGIMGLIVMGGGVVVMVMRLCCI